MKELSPPVCRRADGGSFPRMEAPSPSIRLSALGKTRGRTDEGAGGGMRKIGGGRRADGLGGGIFSAKGQSRATRGVPVSNFATDTISPSFSADDAGSLQRCG